MEQTLQLKTIYQDGNVVVTDYHITNATEVVFQIYAYNLKVIILYAKANQTLVFIFYKMLSIMISLQVVKL